MIKLIMIKDNDNDNDKRERCTIVPISGPQWKCNVIRFKIQPVLPNLTTAHRINVSFLFHVTA